MGIKNLNKFLRNNCPNVFEPVHISNYAFKKIAIDISLYLCKFKTICGDRWLASFINLIACLRRNEIHCVFIYDNGAPPEKDAERAKRAEVREKNENKVYELEQALDEYYKSGEIASILSDLDTSPKKLLRLGTSSVNMELVDAKIKKMRSYILTITREDFKMTKTLFDILKVPYFVAPLEAETMCADLCKRGIVDSVLSEDTDVIAYETPLFLSKIDTVNDTCVQIKYSDVLEGLKLTNIEFLDLCIMCGTDYNSNIFRVGPEKAYKLIQEHSTIENIKLNTKLDTSILKHTVTRRLFKEYEKSKLKTVPYCGVPDFNKLQEFMFKNNIRLDMNNLKSSFARTELCFE